MKLKLSDIFNPLNGTVIELVREKQELDTKYIDYIMTLSEHKLENSKPVLPFPESYSARNY